MDDGRPVSRSTPQPSKRFEVMSLAGMMILTLLCIVAAAPGNIRPAFAQGLSPTNTVPTPAPCMHIAYSRVTENSVVIGVRNTSGATLRLSNASLDWPATELGGGDYVDYFMFYTGTFNTANNYNSPNSSPAPGTGTAYNIGDGVTREFVAAFGPLPLPVPLAGSFTVTLDFGASCSVSATVERPQEFTPTFLPTNTLATPGVCMSVQYAYATEQSIVVGVRNNTASSTRLQTAALDWPSGLGGTGGIYVDYFQFAGNQFYGGNSTAPPTSYTRTSSSAFAIGAGQTRNFAAVFGLAPLTRPLYGAFTVSLTFFNTCTVSVTVVRAPPPSSCPTITSAYISGANLIFTVYNGTGADTTFTGAWLDWTDITSPNRYVNYFSWGTDRFWGVTPAANDYDPPTAATDPTPDAFAAGQTTAFTASFGNPGVLSGNFSVELSFGVPCTAAYQIWWGMTPTFTPSPTATETPSPTNTPTPIPLMGASSVRFPALLLNAPDFDLPAQSIYGNVNGGYPPYAVTVYIKAPSQNASNATTYSVNLSGPGSFVISPATTGDTYLGCSEEGIWEAWFEIDDDSGDPVVESTHITWTVNFPQAHGVP